MFRRALPLATCALLLSAACKDEPPSPATAGQPAQADPTPTAAPSAQAAAAEAAAEAAPAGAALEITDAAGKVSIRIEPKPEGGYRLKDGSGTKIGKISVQADRVKVKDANGNPKAKVKRKDDGFKLYAPDDSVVLKGKLKGEEGLKLKTGDDQKIGKLFGSSGKIGDQKVEVKVVDGGLEVHRGGALVAKVKGSLRAEPAALLALDQLDDYQRAALLVFVQEVF